MGALEGSPWLSLRPFLASRQAMQVLVQRQHPGPRLGRQTRPPSEEESHWSQPSYLGSNSKGNNFGPQFPHLSNGHRLVKRIQCSQGQEFCLLRSLLSPGHLEWCLVIHQVLSKC